MIEIRDVSKDYSGKLVVDGVTLSLPAGGIVSVIGPNGAGKSTLLSMISRLMPMSAGSVTVDGMDVTRTPSDVLAKRLSVLRQDNQLMAKLTVRDLVAFGRFPHSRGRITAEDDRHIRQALEFLDLHALADRFLDELSGGQRQRAFVAMVLCQDTDYVLLDEPLNNLDMKHAAGMMRLLRRAADELGKTVVVVLHDINFASCYSDHIVAMRDGRVAAQGAPEEIMESGIIRSIFGIDVSIFREETGIYALYYR
ncbi:iron complex transport system ATP-binding protein [Aquamicrobium lusatiense]|uniref:Iron complex transport system ATP-binding protein n=1 Tax=Aquamicrobium lusatiense TaxID=89772 RepID=A0A7W9RZI1_9HYPH|nr:ABC transporter ATP-binding protein [Aquamicrobium lusatiense]MBB6011361.1 iron complex transport system ATP-binding protein [Aquamicrobium lusatiense]